MGIQCPSVQRIKNFQFKRHCNSVAYDQINKVLPKSFHTFFTLKTEQFWDNTRRNSLKVPSVKTTTTYGSKSVIFCLIRDWNNLQNKLNPDSALPDLSVTWLNFLKTIKKITADRVEIYKTQIHLYLGPSS